jgi:predicted alpha/beta hydrolase
LIRFPARDGRILGGDLFAPDHPRGCVLIGPAMAVPARFYAKYAQHLANTGLAALAVDYRGIGASKTLPIKDDPARFQDWGEQDLAGAADFLRKSYPGLPLHFVGHSAGGQLMGLMEGVPIASALFVSSGTASWRAYEGRSRAVMFGLFHAVLPAALAWKGYLPMSAVRRGEDVPKGVAAQWAEWGRHERYVRKHADPQGGLGFERYDGPLRAVAFKDDAYAPPKAVQGLLSLYTKARKELIVHDGPAGHFGFFKQPALWAEPVFAISGETKAG